MISVISYCVINYLLILGTAKNLKKKKEMKFRIKFPISLLVILIAFMVASCSTPQYRKNKYKSAKRFNNCGCTATPKQDNSLLSFNEQK